MLPSNREHAAAVRRREPIWRLWRICAYGGWTVFTVITRRSLPPTGNDLSDDGAVEGLALLSLERAAYDWRIS
jgi:hypothetical protein